MTVKQRAMPSHRIKYYSQNGEDCLLWDFFGCGESGFFLDIGAFDGMYLSNTFLFENMGWRGICVEANPDYFPLLVKNRPRSLCLHCACVKEMNQRRTEFFVEEMGLFSSLIHSEEFVDDVRSRYAKRGVSFSGIRAVEVPAATVGELLELHHHEETPIDLVSLDVEGTELSVLEGFDFDRYSFRVIVVEANTDAVRAEIRDFLAHEKGFLYAGSLVENLFFVKERGDLERIRGIEIECRIERQSHPLGDEYSTAANLEGKVIDARNRNRLAW